MPLPDFEVGEPPPVPTSLSQVGFTPQGRVRWFAPAVLARTAVQVAIATKFAEVLDRRDLQASLECRLLDLSEAGEEMWLDYTADTADGFDATATVASVLARDELVLDGVGTRGGSLLVLGGDAVYPAAGEQAYHDRLVGPFRAVRPWSENPRWVVALPGNHDWYDGLTSFLRVFCRRPVGRWLGIWQTLQSRSYWAVRLPHGWWLWGVDVQLGTYIDPAQLAYFQRMRSELGPGDRIVLCWAKPTWIHPVAEDAKLSKGLDFFIDRIIGDRSLVRLCLAGDTHHYARHVPVDPAHAQRITVGGGGAYLSGTHYLQDTAGFTVAARYPDAETSRRLAGQVLPALYANPRFPLVPAALYSLSALPAAWLASSGSLGAFACTLIAVGAMWLLLGQFARFSGRGTIWGVRAAAALHLLLHGVIIGGVLAACRAVAWESVTVGVLACAAAGAAVGPLATGLYLRVAQEFDVNVNEAFSAMAIQDYKCFLRIRLGADGDLTLYPVKLERCPRWRFGPDASGRWFRPDTEPVPELIEQPIVVTKAPTPPTRASAAQESRPEDLS